MNSSLDDDGNVAMTTALTNDVIQSVEIQQKIDAHSIQVQTTNFPIFNTISHVNH